MNSVRCEQTEVALDKPIGVDRLDRDRSAVNAGWSGWHENSHGNADKLRQSGWRTLVEAGWSTPRGGQPRVALD